MKQGPASGPLLADLLVGAGEFTGDSPGEHRESLEQRVDPLRGLLFEICELRGSHLLHPFKHPLFFEKRLFCVARAEAPHGGFEDQLGIVVDVSEDAGASRSTARRMGSSVSTGLSVGIRRPGCLLIGVTGAGSVNWKLISGTGSYLIGSMMTRAGTYSGT